MSNQEMKQLRANQLSIRFNDDSVFENEQLSRDRLKVYITYVQERCQQDCFEFITMEEIANQNYIQTTYEVDDTQCH